MWTEFNCFELLWTWHWTFRFHKSREYFKRLTLHHGVCQAVNTGDEKSWVQSITWTGFLVDNVYVGRVLPYMSINMTCSLLFQVSMDIALCIMPPPRASTCLGATCMASTGPSSPTSCMRFIIRLVSGPFCPHLKSTIPQDFIWFVFIACVTGDMHLNLRCQFFWLMWLRWLWVGWLMWYAVAL